VKGGSGSVRSFVLRFALAFVALELLVFLVLWHPTLFQPYAELNASGTAALFAPWIDGIRGMGNYLVSPGFSILVKPGCDAYQPAAVLVAGVVAFPASRGRKWLGAVAGVGILLALNVLRLGALMWTGLHHRDSFDSMHLEVLPGVYLLVALGLWLAWSWWARAPSLRKDPTSAG